MHVFMQQGERVQIVFSQPGEVTVEAEKVTVTERPYKYRRLDSSRLFTIYLTTKLVLETIRATLSIPYPLHESQSFLELAGDRDPTVIWNRLSDVLCEIYPANAEHAPLSDIDFNNYDGKPATVGDIIEFVWTVYVMDINEFHEEADGKQ